MINPEPVLRFVRALGLPTQIAVIVGLCLLLVVIALLAKSVDSRNRWRDPVRFFTWPQKRQLIAQANGRCEHKSVLWRRCPRPGTEADHIIPWSKHGRTVIENGQLLCRAHNMTKLNYMPNAFYQWRLARRRKRYRS